MNQDFNRPTLPELPQFISCKTVRAAAIAGINGPALQLESGELVTVDQQWLAKHQPSPGWWLIQYPDGYVSAAPADVITRDYTPIGAWGLPIEQESKYTVNAQGRLVNRDTGVAIPDDEPVFVFRAQDRDASDSLEHYQGRALSQSRHDAIGQRAAAFDQFAMYHPERMKDAD